MEKCTICSIEIPEHFRQKAMQFCFACQSEQIGLSRILEPRVRQKTYFETCPLCTNPTSPQHRALSLCDSCLKLLELNSQKSTTALEQSMTRPWMIKSAGRILGPMSQEEVERAIRAKEIGAFDEITRSYGGWKYVREEEDFGIIIEELKNKVSSREDTLSITFIEGHDNTAKLEDGVPVRDVAALHPTDLDPAKAPIKYYDIHGKVSKSSRQRAILIFVVLMLLIATGYIWDKFRKSTENTVPKNSAQIELLMNQGLFAQNQMERERILGLLRQAYDDNKTDARLGLNLALMYIQDRQTVQGVRLLEDLSGMELVPPQKNEVQVGLALGEILNGQFEDARSRLHRVLEENPTNFPALINLGACEMLDKKWDEMAAPLNKAFEINPHDGTLALLYAEAALRHFDFNAKNNFLDEAQQRVRSVWGFASEYRQEASIYLASIAHKRGLNEDAQRFFESFLELDPELTQDHLHPLLYYREHAKWENILKRCRDLHNAISQTPRVSAALGLCQFKGGEVLVGKQVIEDALKRAPEDSLIQTVFSYILYQTGHNDLALAGLKKVIENPSAPSLAWLVSGRQCLIHLDYDCAKKSFDNLQNDSAFALQNNAAQVILAFQSGNRTEAERLINEGEKISSSYIPLLKLKEKIKESSHP